MRIKLTSIYVDDQRAALAFYTDVLASRSTTTSRSATTSGSPSSRRAPLAARSCCWSRPAIRRSIGPAVVAVFDDTCGNLIQLIADEPATAAPH